MDKSSLRVYADTSVFGGMFDKEFERPTRLFFKMVAEGKIHLVTSALVEEELTPAPELVRGLFSGLRKYNEIVSFTPDAMELRKAYIRAGIVSSHSLADALHVALATVHQCPILVSWNCKHIVHFQKIPKYNAVNLLHGFPNISLYTPLEVVGDEKEI